MNEAAIVFPKESSWNMIFLFFFFKGKRKCIQIFRCAYFFCPTSENKQSLPLLMGLFRNIIFKGLFMWAKLLFVLVSPGRFCIRSRKETKHGCDSFCFSAYNSHTKRTRHWLDQTSSSGLTWNSQVPHHSVFINDRPRVQWWSHKTVHGGAGKFLLLRAWWHQSLGHVGERWTAVSSSSNALAKHVAGTYLCGSTDISPF